MDNGKKPDAGRKKLSDFELAEIYMRRVSLLRIDGKLHLYTGKYFQALNRGQLETSVLETLKQELRSGSFSRVKAVAGVLQTQALPECSSAGFDGWLGFANGIWNIYSGDYFEHSSPHPPCPITYCLEQISYYEPTYLPPTSHCDRFFYRITGGDAILTQRIWEMIGYILTPDTKAKAFFLLQGVPHSGKSILGRFLESFFPQGRITSLDISRLGGQFLPDAITDSCLNLSMDLPDKPLSTGAIANIKMITGGDLSTQEAKYKEAKAYRSHCKLLFSTNHSLKMREKDSAFLERIICIPFRNAISRQEQDTNLLQKLLLEKEAAAMKALVYYKRLQKNGYQFSGNEAILPDISYQLKPQEIMREFVEARCEFVPYDGGKTYTDDLYNAYVIFCKESGHMQYQESIGFSRLFAALYAGKVISDRWRENGNNRNGYKGVILLPPEDDEYWYNDNADDRDFRYTDANGQTKYNV